MSHDRTAEIARYAGVYKFPGYKMGKGRLAGARRVLQSLPVRGWLLDVGAGRGELGGVADELGFEYRGIEPTSYLASARVSAGLATAIPCLDGAYNVVACLDVLEHLVEEDIVPALHEMLRVASNYILLTAADFPHISVYDGKDLHISKRPLPAWQKMFEDVFAGHKIEFLGKLGVSPGWLITLQEDQRAD